MQQLLILLATPFRFTNGWVEPFVPSGLALLGRFAVEKGCDAGPLLFAVFHYGSFEDFILGVFPGSSFDEDANHGCRFIVLGCLTQVPDCCVAVTAVAVDCYGG